MKKPIADFTPNDENLKSFLLKSGAWKGCLLSPFLFKVVVEILARAIKPRKEKQRNQIGKEEVNSSLHMV